jgi:CRP-like cAMP-binding protein
MKVIAFLNEHFKTNFAEPSSFFVSLGEQAFKKGDIITDYGKVEKKLYFINEGFVQITMLHDGEEKIIDFFFQDTFVCAFSSFLKQEPSDARITALVDCKMEVIHYNDLQEAYKTSLVANRLGRLLTEQIYMVKAKREKDFLLKSAQERYHDLIALRPDIPKLIPINKIAKYLGVKPESLSRIRRTSFPNIG